MEGGNMSNSHTNTKTSDTDYFKAVCVYDNLPQVASNKARTAKTKEQQDALKRIAERINYTLMCINGVCSNVR